MALRLYSRLKKILKNNTVSKPENFMENKSLKLMAAFAAAAVVLSANLSTAQTSDSKSQASSSSSSPTAGLHVSKRGLDETSDDHVARQADLLRCTVARSDSEVVAIDAFDSSTDPRWSLLLRGGGEHVQQSARDCSGK